MLVLFPFNLFDLMYVSSQHLQPENGMKLRIQKRYTYTILYRAYNSQCFFFLGRTLKTCYQSARGPEDQVKQSTNG